VDAQSTSFSNKAVDQPVRIPAMVTCSALTNRAVLDNAGKLGKIVVGMNRALGEIPLTVKIRTGVKEGKNNAHKLMPRLAAEWSASAITLHGRTRQQRYTKLADWDYIKQCVEAVRAKEADEDCMWHILFRYNRCSCFGQCPLFQYLVAEIAIRLKITGTRSTLMA
jgi:Dihydrouridine synthase (Dus)